MKELTIEEKAARYDETLAKAKRYYNEYKTRDNILYVEDMEDMFPELKESEDEGIRQKLLSLCYAWRNNERVKIPSKKEVEKTIAWLEKQGEQKSINYTDEEIVEAVKDTSVLDKVEPKFKEGDWVIDKQGITHQIANVVETVPIHTYGYDIVGGGYFNDNTEGVRLWTIQDAKDGDVLAYPDGSITLFNYLFENIYMAHVLWVDGHIELNNSCAIFNVHPATKEQRDLLFKKVKEAGYEWDVEKKKLRKC